MNQHEMATKKLPHTTLTQQNTYCNNECSFLISSELPAICLLELQHISNQPYNKLKILKETPKGSAIYGKYATEGKNKRK
jgi:hypothetical protein